eukprot:m.479111 g.479111  ORF g.479111 m.479111 type:complete len:263 (-) comp21321_c0_seq1:346-1134(-)
MKHKQASLVDRVTVFVQHRRWLVAGVLCVLLFLALVSMRSTEKPKLDPHQLSELKPMMYNDERDLVMKYLLPEHTYLEWGSGGSTVVYGARAKEAWSIEHDGPWCEVLSEELKRRELNSVHYNCVPRAKGERGWGGGFEEGTYTQFTEYVDKIDELDLKKPLDFILVDGRARTACAVKAIAYMSETSRLAFHDWHSAGYHTPTLEYFDIVEAVDRIAILAVKKEFLGQRLPIPESGTKWTGPFNKVADKIWDFFNDRKHSGE